MKNKYKLIFNEIKKFDTIYISRHIGPDPDAVASQLSLRDSIKLTFPKKKVFAIGSSVARFKYLGKLDKVERFDYENSLVIALDVPDLKRNDGIDLTRFKNIIKIDHHPFIETYGYIEAIDDTSSSTCELIYDLINTTKLKCNKDIASKIFAGIVSDTNRFLFDYTSSKTFDTVNKLIEKEKINIHELYKQIYARPVTDIRLLGYIASNIKVTKNGFAYIKLDNDILNSFGSDSSCASNLINDFGNINEIIVWTFVTYDEKEGIYKVNIRSRGPIINEIASKYHGGGHKYASGARTKDKEDVDNLLSDLESACIKYNKENK